MTTRDYALRKLPSSKDDSCMDYPYGYIHPKSSRYSLEYIRKPILVEEEEADADKFPWSIREHFWFVEGNNLGEDWISCGLLDNGNYFFYKGDCSYTGFSVYGHMSLWVSESWKNIVDYVMTESEYELYMQETTEAPVEDEDTVCGTCMIRLAYKHTLTSEDGPLCGDCLRDLEWERKKKEEERQEQQKKQKSKHSASRS